MRSKVVVAVSAVLALALGSAPAATAARAPRAPEGAFEPGEVLLRFRPGASRADRAAALAAVGGRVERTIPGIRTHVVRLGAGVGVPAAVRALGALPAIDAVEPNHRGHVAAAIVPNDPCIGGCFNGWRQWDVGAVNAPPAWGVVPGRFYDSTSKLGIADPIKVAVLDTRIDPDHGDWRNAAAPPDQAYDARKGGQLAWSDRLDLIGSARWYGTAYYHGTFVAGILGAGANNASHIAGFGYHSQVMPVTVVDGNGVATAGDVAAGIDHAREHGARVINLSLVLSEPSFAVGDAISQATDEGILVVAAAGNNASGVPVYPAAYPEVMAVAATDEADRRAGCSNYGSHISVSAPGEGILSLEPTRAEGLWVAPCGTSTAAPHVSALAALLFAQDPTRTPAQVRDIIEATADDDRFYAGPDVYFGHGRVNFERALRLGEGPTVSRVVSTTPPATGGTAEISATATAPQGGVVRGAELAIDSPGSQTYPMTAADGTFDERDEEVTVPDLSVPITFPTGVHRVFVRATDGTTWGPASVGVLIVDRGRPKVQNLTASPGIRGVEPVRVSFQATDDYSATVQYQIVVTKQIVGGEVYRSSWKTIAAETTEQAMWVPGLLDAGAFQLTVVVKDDAGMQGNGTVGTLVL